MSQSQEHQQYITFLQRLLGPLLEAYSSAVIFVHNFSGPVLESEYIQKLHRHLISRTERNVAVYGMLNWFWNWIWIILFFIPQGSPNWISVCLSLGFLSCSWECYLQSCEECSESLQGNWSKCLVLRAGDCWVSFQYWAQFGHFMESVQCHFKVSDYIWGNVLWVWSILVSFRLRTVTETTSCRTGHFLPLGRPVLMDGWLDIFIHSKWCSSVLLCVPIEQYWKAKSMFCAQ